MSVKSAIFAGMKAGMEKELYKKCSAKKITLRHICEVGVFLPEMSNILDFIVKDRLRTTLVEPDLRSIAAIRDYFRDYNNVTLLPYAVYDRHGVLELVQRSASTFVSTLPYSPAQINDDYQIREEDRFTVECRTFNELDDGTSWSAARRSFRLRHMARAISIRSIARSAAGWLRMAMSGGG